MPEKNTPSLPFESGDEQEQALWAALAELPRGTPSPRLRRDFYARLEQGETQSWAGRLRGWLGLGSNTGWLTATACLLLGFGMAQVLGPQAGATAERLAKLEQNITLLSRELVLDRLQDEGVGTRLLGVHAASGLAATDPEVVQALLRRATEDRVLSVRAAAIDALAPQMTSDRVGGELMKLLANAESPIVQLSLVDLVLRNGSQAQLRQLLELARAGELHPDLVPHVTESIRGEAI